MPVAPPEDPFDSLEQLLAFNVRDWSTDKGDAWLYGIISGWDLEREPVEGGVEDGAMQEVADRHGWDADAVARLRRLRARYLAVTKDRIPRRND